MSLACHRRQFHQALLAGLLLGQIRLAWAAKPDEAALPVHFIHANNAFALSLLRAIDARGERDNQFFSPFSIESALSIALEGARGPTAAEMGRVLHYPSQLAGSGAMPWAMESVRNDFKTLAEQFASDKSLASARPTADGYQLQSANSLWVDKAFPLSAKYRQIIEDFYGSSGAFACDFQNKSDVERVRINDWVSDQTADKIKELIPLGAINPLTRLVIANAIYFKGTWLKAFDASATKRAAFTTHEGTKSQTSLMTAHEFDKGRYAAFNEDGSLFETPETISGASDPQRGYPSGSGFQVAELPFKGDTLAMMVFLPRAADGLDALVKSLTAEKIHSCALQLQSRKFHVALPKFKLETRYALNDHLQSMGMQKAFSQTDADFGGLTESDDPQHELYISAVFHKAFVDVNEEGTEAAAATGVVMTTRAAAIDARPFIPKFTADHPFLFTIRNKKSGLILFLGKFEKP